MDRSNSVSSTSSSSRHGSSAEPFAYQTRILERTSSLSKSNSLLSKNGTFSSNSTPSGSNGSRKWTPSHRVGNSIDSVRGKWEERAKAEAAITNQTSPSRSSFIVEDNAPTVPSSPVQESQAQDSKPLATHSFQISSSVQTANDSRTPTLLKRHTMPAPIFASPLSPNNTGISVTSPDSPFYSMGSPLMTPTHRIRFPVSKANQPSTVSSARQMFEGLETSSGMNSLSSIASLSRTRRSIDFDSIMKGSRSSLIETSEPSTYTSLSLQEELNPRRLRSTAHENSNSSSPTKPTSAKVPLSSPSPERKSQYIFHDTPPERISRPSSPEKMDLPYPGKLTRASTFEDSSKQDPSTPSSLTKLTRQLSHNSSQVDITKKSIFVIPTSVKQDNERLRTPSPERLSLSKPAPYAPERASKTSPASDSTFLRSSSSSSDILSSKLNQGAYRPPPVAPSAYANPDPSVMFPTPYRSSYMSNKKSGTYGENLVVGRRLGRHLPRIASGDRYEEPDLGTEKVQPPPEKENRVIGAGKSLEASTRLSRLERREKRLREWKLEMERSAPPPPPKDGNSDAEAFDHPSSGDVVGIPGRLRLSRDVVAPPSPLGAPPSYANVPLPSSRLGARGGLWADTQRHLLRAYEYLCHVGEAQQWIEGCLGEELGFGVVEMEEGLRNGVVLAKLARVFLGEGVVRRIFEAPKLDYRQTDNINHFFYFIHEVGLPECFIFETTDLYNKKNIPKVIYCIHALSHLLARRGLAERIGNLLGQLKFSDDQLQATEKGLKDAGVPMPNFGNIGRELAKEINEEPEVEVETEEERRDRLLLENEESIIGLQSTMRGFLIRKAMATQRARMRLAEKSVIKLQALLRGASARIRIQEHRKQQVYLRPWVIALQARARGLIIRRIWRDHRSRLLSLRRSVVKVQAQARGVLVRCRFALLKGALVKSEFSVLKIQAIARAKLAMKSHQQLHKTLDQVRTMRGIVGLQARARTLLTQRRFVNVKKSLHDEVHSIISLQAQVRGVLVRRRMRAQLAKLDDVAEIVLRIQAAVRSYLSRKRLLNLIRSLRRATPAIVAIQSLARANLQRQQTIALQKALGEVKLISSVGGLQAMARATLVRTRRQEQTKKFKFVEPDVKSLQACCRGALVRQHYISWRDHIRNSHGEATRLQALVRGLLERRKFREKMRYYRENLEKVVKIQSLFRAKERREQYRQLTLGRNVNVGTIKNFVHLLDDSEADFEDEIEVERLRKRVVQNIRENQALETEVNELDVKIALVVQNVKSFEELVRARRRHGAETAAAHASRASVLAAHGDPFAGPNALDHDTKRKLELYQQLFYLLQTRGDYLSKLFRQLAKTESIDKNNKLVERVVLTLYGYGQDRREEYLLLKLFQASIKGEISMAPTVESTLLDIPMYLSIAFQYGRTKQVSYAKEMLQPLVWTVIDGVVNGEKLDLETDPRNIYRSRINIEEMRTGMPSNKPKDVTYAQALSDDSVRVIFIQNLQKLHALAKDFVNVITQSTKKMPYNIRFIAHEILEALKDKFPDQSDEDYATTLGTLLFYRYINPAIVAPETFDIVPNTIDIASRKNLAQVSKFISQIASGKEFGEEDPCLHPLDKYVAQAIKQMRTWFFEVADIPDAEAQYHANEFLDVAVQPKPIYISPNEVYSMHTLLSQNLDRIVSSRDDPLRHILSELGGAPNLGSEELNAARDAAVTLELTNRFANVKDPHAEEKALWVQAKRAVLAILRVQPARDLVECLMQPVSEEHEMFWEDIVDREMMNDHMRQRKRRMPSTTGAESAYRLDDIRSLTFKEVKAHAIYFLLELEKQGKVTREDGYQGILNAIAGDVRSKHRKRLQRQQELESMSEALQHLSERKKYYEEQIKSYNNYVEAAMNTMQRGKSKKRFVMPFTKQYFHLRDLQRTGKSPQFGSFKYSAQDLYDKGILLSIDPYSPRQFDRIDLVLSSNKPGIFNMELYNTMIGTSVPVAETEIRMEDLLQAQFENRVAFALFEGIAKFNLNLLLYQINKKFYV